MELGFWQKRWDAREIGFHEGAPNALLAQYGDYLRSPSRVLVPLCGKAEDMAYLAGKGHAIAGVEAVRAPCVEFFDEHALTRTEEPRGPFTLHRSGAIEIWQGDMFAATPALLGTFEAAYDRAALVAIAPMTRVKYVDTLKNLLRPKGRLLLNTFSYDQSKVQGPPWSIDPVLVRSLFRRHFVVEPLDSRVVSVNPRMKAAGVTEIREHVSLLTRL
jgi:thiopurine S-methyltransferase